MTTASAQEATTTTQSTSKVLAVDTQHHAPSNNIGNASKVLEESETPTTACTTGTDLTQDMMVDETTTATTATANNGDAPQDDPKNNNNNNNEEDINTSSRTRRSKRRSTNQNGDTAPPPAVKKAKKSSSNTKKSTTTKKEQDLLDMSWICTACREAECSLDLNSDLLVCEGPCKRLFHWACAGLGGMPAADTIWQCHDCLSQKHDCSFCQLAGHDNVDLWKCQKPECGHFFHEGCLAMQNIPLDVVTTLEPTTTKEEDDNKKEVMDVEPTEDITMGPTSNPTEAEPQRILKFTCPSHWCWTCTQTDLVASEEVDNNNNHKSKNDNKSSAKKSKTKKLKNPKKGGASALFAVKKEKRLFPCLECPTSYHITCIPPSAKFHELALLCHNCADKSELPALDLENSLQGSVEAAVDKKLHSLNQKEENLLRAHRKRNPFLRLRQSKNPFFPAGVTGERRTAKEQLVLSKLARNAMADHETNKNNEKDDDANNPDKPEPNPTVAIATTMMLSAANNTTGSSSSSNHDRILFTLPLDLQEEVHSKPPPYKHIHSLKYYPENRPKRIPPPKDVCSCVDKCDDNCLNRLLYMECFGDVSANNGGGGGGGGRHGTNCRLGPNCGNRRLAQRQSVKKCKPEREKGRGWGLVTLEPIKKGDLVQEYLGDVIDEKTKEERLKQWSIDHPNDTNFYIMCLSQGWYIDARETSNLARFVNHSCDPNCNLTRFNVGGYMRDGIFAKRDIKPGEFLSYDYHFDTKQGDKFLCRCGSKNCRGTMKEKNLTKVGDPSATKTKRQLWDDAKQQYEKDKEFLQQVESHQQRNAIIQAVLPSNKPSAVMTSENGSNSAGNGNGDTVRKQMWVSNGLQDKHRLLAIQSRIFLWRNAVMGSNFAARSARYSLPTDDGTAVHRLKQKVTRKPDDPDAKTKTIDVIASLWESNTRSSG